MVLNYTTEPLDLESRVRYNSKSFLTYVCENERILMPIKFSVLLPTRNRLEYLKHAITTVREQEYPHWEIIISDNDSEDDISGYISSLKDERIQYSRTESFIPVTDNWNRALEKATGDYLIMLGDDDALVKNYFLTILDLLEEYKQPDAIYTKALQYTYPDVIPNISHGKLIEWENACFMRGRGEPFFLSKEERVELVKKTLSFSVVFNYNMQFTLFSQKFVRKLKEKGSFFQSPYPDYYATTAIMLTAENILVVPRPLVIVGITKKSFGYYYLNEKEKEGNKFLQNAATPSSLKRLEKYFLPGTEMNTSWLHANETVSTNFKDVANLPVNYGKYRFLQLLYQIKVLLMEKKFNLKNFFKNLPYLSWKEKILYFSPLLTLLIFLRLIPRKGRRFWLFHHMTIGLSHPKLSLNEIDGEFNTILDVFKKYV